MKTFICKECNARFSGSDIASKNGGTEFECPKCGAKNAKRFEEKGVRRRRWKKLENFIKDNI